MCKYAGKYVMKNRINNLKVHSASDGVTIFHYLPRRKLLKI